jgi:uncharacterized protein
MSYPASTLEPSPFIRIKARQIIPVFLAMAIGVNTVRSAVWEWGEFVPRDPIWLLIDYIILMLMMSGWLSWRLRSVGGYLPNLLGKMSTKPNYWRLTGLTIAAVGTSIGAFMLITYGLSIANPTFFAKLVKGIQVMRIQSSAWPDLHRVVTALVLVIVAPVTEEFLFRGFLLHRWSHKWGTLSGLIATSVLFGLLHTNPIGTGIFGFIAGLLYLKTRTLWMPIIFHAINNTIASVGMMRPSDPGHGDVMTNAFQNPSGLYGWIGLVLLALAAPWLIRFSRKNWPSRDQIMPYSANHLVRIQRMKNE